MNDIHCAIQGAKSSIEFIAAASTSSKSHRCLFAFTYVSHAVRADLSLSTSNRIR